MTCCKRKSHSGCEDLEARFGRRAEKWMPVMLQQSTGGNA